MIHVRDLRFSYKNDGQDVPILRGISFDLPRGDLVAIHGPSGSGKSTLFHMLGCLLRPDSGTITINGREISGLDDTGRAHFRNQELGFVFQQFYLLPRATVLENILLPLQYPRTLKITPEIRKKAYEMAKLVGLENHLDRRPNQLSGGQQQRVAIARALMNDPALILADEPTGNLDSKNAAAVLELFHQLHALGRTIVIITHDPEVSAQCARTLYLRDGELKEIREGTPRHQRDPALEQSPATSRLPVSQYAPTGAAMVQAAVPLAWENLGRNKAKSFLTMLGVMIGIASVLAMYTFGRFTQTKILESYQTMGANKVGLRGYKNWELKATDQTEVAFQSFSVPFDLEPLSRVFRDIRSYSPVLVNWNPSGTQYSGLEYNENLKTYGVNANYFRIMGFEFALGKGFSATHVEDRTPVCVIGRTIADRLFKGVSPIGEIIFTSGEEGALFPCQITGVLKAVSSSEGWNKPDSQIYIPYTYFISVHDQWRGEITDVALEARPGSDIEKLAPALKTFFDSKYGKSGRFFSDANAVLVAQMKKFLSLFTLMLSAIAIISLVVGGIGINNMMLVAVTERLKEIGLRKAVGATSAMIRMQLLTESTLLCLMGGLIGGVMGFATYEIIIYLASKFVSKLQFEWVFEPAAFILSGASILVVGVLSGLAPALKAEKLEVIEALKSE